MSDDLCANCKSRPATMNWSESGSGLDFVHGNYTRWCDHCAVTRQLAFARERAADIPRLEARLANLEKADG